MAEITEVTTLNLSRTSISIYSIWSDEADEVAEGLQAVVHVADKPGESDRAYTPSQLIIQILNAADGEDFDRDALLVAAAQLNSQSANPIDLSLKVEGK
jgi:hypothetical protein